MCLHCRPPDHRASAYVPRQYCIHRSHSRAHRLGKKVGSTANLARLLRAAKADHCRIRRLTNGKLAIDATGITTGAHPITDFIAAAPPIRRAINAIRNQTIPENANALTSALNNEYFRSSEAMANFCLFLEIVYIDTNIAIYDEKIMPMRTRADPIPSVPDASRINIVAKIATIEIKIIVHGHLALIFRLRSHKALCDCLSMLNFRTKRQLQVLHHRIRHNSCRQPRPKQ